MTYSDSYLQAAYDNHSGDNESEVRESENCGCFACFGTFSISQIWDFQSNMAFCPYCWMDTVLGDKSGLPVNEEKFLRALNSKIFHGAVFFDQISDPHALTVGVRWLSDKPGAIGTCRPIYAESSKC